MWALGNCSTALNKCSEKMATFNLVSFSEHVSLKGSLFLERSPEPLPECPW